MDIQSDIHGSIGFVRVTGRIDTVTSPQFDEAISQLLAQEIYSVVIDLAAVDYLSSSAFRVFVKYQKLCRGDDGQVVMQGVGSALLGIFKISGFDRLFTFTTSDSDSLSAF